MFLRRALPLAALLLSPAQSGRAPLRRTSRRLRLRLSDQDLQLRLPAPTAGNGLSRRRAERKTERPDPGAVARQELLRRHLAQQSIQVLSAAGYRIVAPDQIGFCKSSKPAHYQYSFQQLAANTRALLDHLASPGRP